MLHDIIREEEERIAAAKAERANDPTGQLAIAKSGPRPTAAAAAAAGKSHSTMSPEEEAEHDKQWNDLYKTEVVDGARVGASPHAGLANFDCFKHLRATHMAYARSLTNNLLKANPPVAFLRGEFHMSRPMCLTFALRVASCKKTPMVGGSALRKHFDGDLLLADLGYLGSHPRHISLPFKKPGSRELTDEEFWSNMSLARYRSRVEHTFANFKGRFKYFANSGAVRDLELHGVLFKLACLAYSYGQSEANRKFPKYWAVLLRHALYRTSIAAATSCSAMAVLLGLSTLRKASVKGSGCWSSSSFWSFCSFASSCSFSAMTKRSR